MSDKTTVVKDIDRRASHERAVRLLRDSLHDASAVLAKSLSHVSSPSDPVTSHMDPVTSHMIETILERYSQQLSTQVCELFRRKLDEMDTQPPDATKLWLRFTLCICRIPACRYIMSAMLSNCHSYCFSLSMSRDCQCNLHYLTHCFVVKILVQQTVNRFNMIFILKSALHVTGCKFVVGDKKT